jgi:hypothetical protein
MKKRTALLTLCLLLLPICAFARTSHRIKEVSDSGKFLRLGWMVNFTVPWPDLWRALSKSASCSGLAPK